MIEFYTRLSTLYKMPENFRRTQNLEHFAEAGFYFDIEFGHQDDCGSTTYRKMTDYISKQHKSTRLPPESLGINVEKPKFPQYALMSRRLESFASWPEYLPVAVKDLVDAGLVYTGVGDSVRCYHCGGGLRNWEPEDDPMKEHVKRYPACPHLLLLKGKWYIEKVRNGEPLEDGFDSEQGVSTAQLSEPPIDYLDSPAAQSCVKMGYSNEMVKQAISMYRQRHGNPDFKRRDLCEILLDLHELEPIDELMEENERLKNDNVCKICSDNRADVIFLPCGHIVTCPQCAPAFTKCPICRKTINGQIKALFAIMSDTR